MPEPLRVAYTLEQCWHEVPGGSAVAAIEVLRRMSGRDDVEMIGVAGRHRRPPAGAFAPPTAATSLPIGRPWLYETWNRFEWPRVEAATGPVDVCHSTIAIPAPSRAASVVTVHDVTFVHTPERFSKHGVRVMRRGLERCRGADLVLCPSRSTAADLSTLGFDEARIRVVPWGVESAPVDTAAIGRVRRVHGLPAEFVLFVGTIEPRKNLARLARAADSLGVPLVVAGATGWGDVDVSVDGVRFLGFVPDADLRPLMAAADAFAYPSLEEGFGLPILEAMAQGTPVVTSRGSATEEVAGGAAVLVDPLHVDAIAEGIRLALDDRARWVAAARDRAATFSWEASVDATIVAYREVAG